MTDRNDHSTLFVYDQRLAADQDGRRLGPSDR